ncbi:MAG: outer membrane protein assembly factor BamE [Desulfohalobiaceae bacterium]
MHPRRRWFAWVLLAGFIGLTGCATVGHEFPVDQVRKLEIGQTTREEVFDMFGAPWRTGIEDGLTTWTYAQYKKTATETMTRDLVIRFDDQGRVVSYTFNSNYPEDRDL